MDSYPIIENTFPKFRFWTSVLMASIFKLLFLKSYRSTDFEVHRNWLALTHSLPLEKWYYEQTSEWTLDYPPLFAYFEWTLAQLAQFIDPQMLQINNLNYASDKTIVFQKVSVVLGDLVLAYGVRRCSESIRVILPGRLSRRNFQMSLFVLIFLNGGLFIVDQIHFQYNGLLYGILLLSISKILQEKFIQGAILFALLLNMKHIFLYIAPAYGIFLFSRYCLQRTENNTSKLFSLKISFGNLLSLVAVVLSVFGASFGPFYQHIPQILSRLFPFKRGLSHAYWAPNIWAIYNSVDLGVNFVLRKTKSSSITGGLVGEHELSVLPQVQPIHTVIITFLFMLPILYKIWKSPTLENFLHGIILTGWTSFMFGYHVHEKAILNVIIPFSLFALSEPNLYVILLISGTYSLFPLLYTPFEIVYKVLISLIHLTMCLVILPSPNLKTYELIYLLGFPVLFIFDLSSGYLIPKYPFLPLICTSNYTFIGIFYTYVRFYFKASS